MHIDSPVRGVGRWLPVRLFRLGCMAYRDARRWQDQAAAAIRQHGAPEALALVEHPPVFTFGIRARPEHLLVSPGELHLRGAELVETDRGGDITFHGPGQLVLYPILDLLSRRLAPVDYVRCLEQTVIRALAEFGVRGKRVSGRPGVWVGDAKIAAVGVRVRRGITTHGLALNVETDLSWFDLIVPCGIAGAHVTSLERELRESPGIEPAADALLAAFAAVFKSQLVSPARSPYRQEAMFVGD